MNAINGQMIAFFAFSTIAVVGSMLVVLKRNPVASAFALVLVFFSFSGLYALMGAHLIAALQILVYTGAIMVLFVFVIMLLNQDSPVMDLKESSGLFKSIAALGTLGLVSVLINAALRATGIAPTGTFTDQKVAELGGNTRAIAELLFTDGLFQFELTSFLLLGAIVATIALSKRQRKGEL